MKLPPEQVWKNALSRLQMEMPKVSFDTWVRDTNLVSYLAASSESATTTFVIGVRNAYARDWLESRITDLATRVLTEIVGADVEVRFILDEPCPIAIDLTDPEPETTDVNVVRRIQYDEVVNPERIVAIPGYFSRLIPEIGARNAWLYIGWRQAVWEGQNNKLGSRTKRVPVQDVIRYSGLSRRTFFRAIDDPITWQALAGLVEQEEDAPQWRQGKDRKAHRLPNRYTVYLTLPLSKRDAVWFHDWLVNQINAGRSLSEAVTAANQIEDMVGTLLPSTVSPLTESITPVPLTVMDIVKELSPEGSLSSDLQKASEALHHKIISAFGMILITHYFLEKVILKANLSPAQAWLVTLARDRCYVNQVTGEVRDDMLVREGYAEMAAWLGLNRSKTIWEWIRDPNGPVSAFICSLPNKDNDEPTALRLRVRLDEPLFDGANDTHRMAQMAQLEGASDTINHGADGTHSMAQMAPIEGAIGTNTWREWHSLKLFNPSSNTNNQNTPNTAGTNVDWLLDEPNQLASQHWGLEDLLRQNHVHAGVAKELIAKNVSVQAFLSWLLFAFSPGGKGIRNPLAYAIASSQINQSGGAGQIFNQFAVLPPTKLLRLVEWSFQKAADRYGYQEECDDPNWVTSMGSSSKFQTLKTILLGKPD